MTTAAPHQTMTKAEAKTSDAWSAGAVQLSIVAKARHRMSGPHRSPGQGHARDDERVVKGPARGGQQRLLTEGGPVARRAKLRLSSRACTGGPRNGPVLVRGVELQLGELRLEARALLPHGERVGGVSGVHHAHVRQLRAEGHLRAALAIGVDAQQNDCIGRLHARESVAARHRLVERRVSGSSLRV